MNIKSVVSLKTLFRVIVFCTPLILGWGLLNPSEQMFVYSENVVLLYTICKLTSIAVVSIVFINLLVLVSGSQKFMSELSKAMNEEEKEELRKEIADNPEACEGLRTLRQSITNMENNLVGKLKYAIRLFEFVSFFWSRYLFGYLDIAETDTSLRPSALLALADQAAVKNLIAGEISGTGQAYKDIIDSN